MRAGQRSLTALGVAAVRAAHQEVDGGQVFADPLARRLIDADREPGGATVRRGREGAGGTDPVPDPVFDAAFDPVHEPVRLVVAARARFGEDALVAAVRGGVRQAVMLGAGLDTFAYRHPHVVDGLRVFEVDHPATQEWKRSLLAAAGVAEPPSLTFAPIDFEESSLSEGLAEAGFDASRAAFFVWLGVVPYLTRASVLGTLGFIGTLPGGSGVVFDYGGPPEAMSPEQRAAFETRAAWAASHGEPFRSRFTPGDLALRLRERGLSIVENITYEALAARYENALSRPPGGSGSHVVHARV